MKKNVLLISLMLSMGLFAQKEINIMSYNVENLFDNKHDEGFQDQEYLSGSIRGWSSGRYRQKLYNIAKVIVAAGRSNPPAIIGLCEIENYAVLDELTNRTGLKNIGYKIVHYESPDARGIDVGLIYRPDEFTVINSRPIKVDLPHTTHTTRDILYLSGTLRNGDTLHIMVNHFPSRLGGELESEERRLTAAGYLREVVDSIFSINANANVVIMGDFNDMPDNDSMAKVIKAQQLPATKDFITHDGLYNLTYQFHKKGKGSYRYGSNWNMLDQIVVSGGLLNSSNKTAIVEDSPRIFSPDWLLQDDKIAGKRPFRTYIGMTFNNGYSDHLPVLVTIKLK